MLDVIIPDLTFPMVAYGRNETPWDLRVLLYKGGAGADYRKVFQSIARGALGCPLLERLELVKRIYEEMTASLVKGGARDTARTIFRRLRGFFAWADLHNAELTLEAVEASYRHWCDFLLHRVRLKAIKEDTAHGQALTVSFILGAALERSRPLIETTRVRRPKNAPRAVSAAADKQNLADTFAFGHLLIDVIHSLRLEAIYGTLPVVIRTRDGRSIEQWSGLQPPEMLAVLQSGYPNRFSTAEALQTRAAWEAEHSLRTRYPLFNLRILAELMLFIGQTGMNLAQARNLNVTHYAYESTIDGYKVYAYKSRARKEVLFEIFSGYKPVFEAWLAFRAEIFGKTTDLMFPIIQPMGGKSHSQLDTKKFRGLCKHLGIPWIPPSELRNTRINWLLRESRDPAMTADMAQHLKETLIRVYEKPSQQVAMREIIQFHRKTDPRLGGNIMPCSAPGVCDGVPQPLPSLPPEAPKPDCTHPAGCLFCEQHRDIDSEDYVWSTASMRHLNTLLLHRFRPQGKNKADPAAYVEVVLAVLTSKIKWFENSNSKRKAWVMEALEKVAEGDFHFHWRYLIESAESI